MTSPWPLLVNFPGNRRTYPYRHRISQLLQESKRLNLDFHRHVNQLLLDFSSLDLKDDSNINNTIQLLNTCPDIERLGIIYDTRFASLVSQGTMLQENIALISKTLEQSRPTKVRQLELVGQNPGLRCPCCSGKNWDHFLRQLLDKLDISELILGHVVPSVEVYRTLSAQKNLSCLVFKRSIMTMSGTTSKKGGEKKIKETSIGRVPKQLWNQISRIEIYEDIEDSTVWRSRYLLELINNVKSLRQLVLHFGTPEENEKMMMSRPSPSIIGTTTISGSSEFELLLSRLIAACKDSLEWILLVNVPNIKSGYVYT
ncbi:hypothetical protein K501DRAFT_174405 [Backusella circina FSU 941]|nr:hypothetical protein K501DRAFT_174405 [Backusella circina FSU 941]